MRQRKPILDLIIANGRVSHSALLAGRSAFQVRTEVADLIAAGIIEACTAATKTKPGTYYRLANPNATKATVCANYGIPDGRD